MSDLSAALGSLSRSMPLVAAGSPKTPLRLLCIMAIETVHLRRYGRALSHASRKNLAHLLDFQACSNAMWDGKDHSPAESHALRHKLDDGGSAAVADEYLARLHEVETRRPAIHGDARCFDEVREYRESVARISFAADLAVAWSDPGLSFGHAVDAIDRDANLNVLFRVAMQCQIMDDVVDYAADLQAGLPTFRTACRPLSDSMALTAGAARAYGESQPGDSMFVLRAVLTTTTAITTSMIHAAGWRHRRADAVATRPRRAASPCGKRSFPHLEDTCRSAGSRPGSR